MAGTNPRDRRITQGWLDALRKRKEFRSVSDRAQRELAHMIWMDAMRVREHFTVEDATSYPYQELHKRFGRSKTDDFNAVNAATDVFFVGPWSHSDGTTKSYKLAPMYKEIKRLYVKGEARKMSSASGISTGDFIDMRGKRFLSIPRAIASKRQDGSAIKLWGGVEITQSVPVNLWNLERLYKQTWKDIKRANEKQLSGNLFGNPQELDMGKLELRAEWAATLLVLANTNLGGHGWLPMRYREAESGRLYAMDDNLQNCPKEVRMAALDGAIDYDISNCHYTLLSQMAASHDIECPEIHNYLKNKTAMRNKIADHLQVDMGKVKTCLLALIYGAKMASHKTPGKARDPAIYKTLGAEKGALLLAMPEFINLANEVRSVGNEVLKNWPMHSGSFINDAGCGIKPTKQKKQMLSHLLQGAEALILKTAVEYLEEKQPGNVILLQHDGFTAKKKIDRSALTNHIEEQTGFVVEWDEDRIQPSADRDFYKVAKQAKPA